MSFILTPKSVSIDTLSNISYPLVSSVSPPLSPITTTYVRPLSPVLSPVSYVVKTNPLTIDTPIINPLPINPLSIAVKPTLYVDIDTGLNDSYLVQQDTTKYFMYKMLDKWIYTEFPSVLKYLVYSNGKVSLVKSLGEKDKNTIENESTDILEAKSDYIGDHILTLTKTRAILIRIMKELGLKWFELPYREAMVKEVMGRYLKKKLKKLVQGVDDEE